MDSKPMQMESKDEEARKKRLMRYQLEMQKIREKGGSKNVTGKSGINVKTFAEGVAKQIREYLPPEYGETTGRHHKGDYDEVKEFLFVRVINTKANRSMLVQMPHRKMGNLSLVCILKFLRR